MLFDEQVFRMAMKKLTAEGNRDAVEDYLLSEFWRLEEGDIAVADSCCCGKSACRLEEEDIAWQRNRLQGQIIVGSELADFYRENKEWRRCFDIYQSLEETVRQGGLSDTEVYGRIRINRAYALLDYGEEEQALELTDEVEALLTRCGSADGDSWSRLCHLQSVIYRRRGEEGPGGGSAAQCGGSYSQQHKGAESAGRSVAESCRGTAADRKPERSPARSGRYDPAAQGGAAGRSIVFHRMESEGEYPLPAERICWRGRGVCSAASCGAGGWRTDAAAERDLPELQQDVCPGGQWRTGARL